MEVMIIFWLIFIVWMQFDLKKEIEKNRNALYSINANQLRKKGLEI